MRNIRLKISLSTGLLNWCGNCVVVVVGGGGGGAVVVVVGGGGGGAVVVVVVGGGGVVGVFNNKIVEVVIKMGVGEVNVDIGTGNWFSFGK